jgi:hypothetical protein
MSTYDWSSLYNKIFFDVAIKRLNVDVTKTTDLPLRSGYIKKHKYPACFLKN